MVNGTLDGFTGQWPAASVKGVGGAVAIPLGVPFAAQFDGQIGQSETENAKGWAGHLFWRDPSRGLIGVYSSQSRADYTGGHTINADNANVNQFGLETEFYVDRFTFQASGGAQSGKFDGNTSRVSAAYYATDNLRLDLSFNQINGLNPQTSVGVELAPFASSTLTLFARASVRDHTDVNVLGGLVFAFGAPEKSLLRHHREDLIHNDLPENLFDAIGDGVCPIGAHHRNGFCDGNI